MKFTKMHGIGNDYVYVNCFEETVTDPSAVAKFVSDRHFGIGSDGLILIKPSDIADCEMDMYNLDGSQGAMCGNGIRCVAKYAYDYGIVNKTSISVATKSGIKYLDLTLGKDGKVADNNTVGRVIYLLKKRSNYNRKKENQKLFPDHTLRDLILLFHINPP